jgi:hypothetical protein
VRSNVGDVRWPDGVVSETGTVKGMETFGLRVGRRPP